MLIGITGTDGAGKGTVVDYLVREKGYIHFSARGFLAAKLIERGLAVDRAALRDIGNELRSELGDGMIVTTALSRMTEEATEYLIIDSIRAVAEVEALKKAGGVLLAVDADIHLRYDRIVGRGSETDTISFDQFVAHEKIEANDPDPHGMQKVKVMELADYTIVNNGTVSELELEIEKACAVLEEVRKGEV